MKLEVKELKRKGYSRYTVKETLTNGFRYHGMYNTRKEAEDRLKRMR